jgi:hypothetical protein
MSAMAVRDKCKSDLHDAMQTRVGRDVPKIAAHKLRLTDSGVRKIASGLSRASTDTVIEAMFEYPEIAALVAEIARRAQEPDFWTYESQRDFHTRMNGRRA